VNDLPLCSRFIAEEKLQVGQGRADEIAESLRSRKDEEGHAIERFSLKLRDARNPLPAPE
jgi:hypothetical protein